jgi:hypothetical protein
VPCGGGLTGFDGTCTDVNECTAGAPCGAASGTTCENIYGSYTCHCPGGYTAPAAGGTCTCPAAVGGTGHGVASCSGPRFTGLGDGTVRDNRDGAVWQQAVPAGFYTQAGAIAYCASLALDGGGWRLPTKDELLSIVDTTRVNPSIDPTYFPATPSDFFWSSSSVAGSPSLGWYVSFDGGAANDLVATESAHARCVR